MQLEAFNTLTGCVTEHEGKKIGWSFSQSFFICKGPADVAEYAEKYKTTDDGRRTTDNSRQTQVVRGLLSVVIQRIQYISISTFNSSIGLRPRCCSTALQRYSNAAGRLAASALFQNVSSRFCCILVRGSCSRSIK